MSDEVFDTERWEQGEPLNCHLTEPIGEDGLYFVGTVRCACCGEPIGVQALVPHDQHTIRAYGGENGITRVELVDLREGHVRAKAMHHH